MTYQEIKDWLKEPDNKNKLVIGASLVLMFIVGFGAGSYQRDIRRNAYVPKTNYTTTAAKQPVTRPVAAETGVVAGDATGTPISSACPVKGNISSAGKKVYHIPGGAFYVKVKPEQCFKTEAEAVAAGFKKSGR